MPESERGADLPNQSSITARTGDEGAVTTDLNVAAPSSTIDWKKLRPLFVALLFIPLLFLIFGDAKQVGDGGEYYAMALALAKNGVPYATPDVWQEYEQLRTSRPDLQIHPAEVSSRFTQLRVGEQQDFPHFWFYSVGPALIYKILSPLGLSLPQAFSAFHCLISIAVTVIAFRCFGVPGIISFFMIWLCSPVLWYSNKAHTEFFTVSFGILAVIAMMKRAPLWALLALSVLATQNPAFGVAALVCGLWFLIPRFSRPVLIWELLLIVAGAVLVLLHPLYYTSRYGEITPQYVTGAAGSFMGWEAALTPLFDPNLGILWGWPLGALALLFLCFRAARDWRLLRDQAPLIFLGMLWVSLAIYSHGSTGHQNHGAVVSCSRYALWYLPLLFPAMLLLARNGFKIDWRKTKTRLLAAGVVLLALFSMIQNLPWWGSYNDHPTPMGWLAMKAAPDLYDPYPQIFIERYMGEWGDRPSLMLHAPSKKLLWDRSAPVMSLSTQDGADVPPQSAGYFFRAAPEYELGDSGAYYQYFHLTGEQVSALLNPPEDFQFQVVEIGKDEAAPYLGSGWHGPEGHHRWTSDSAYIKVPSDVATAVLEVNARFWASFVVTNLETGQEQSYYLAGPGGLVIPLRPEGATSGDFVEFRIDVHSAWKPSEIFGGNDQRILGLSVGKLMLYYE